ncbi:chaperone modulator CbpM [Olivibacter ginsenosidimutans]|uniref:Chaperone modulator CbpM n=1 Tax=Olivibacter ginsenosidimutans TaxID=1176537 RepID=A0ABP9C7K8_9SPHI
MESTLILIKEYCAQCHVEHTFVQSLQDEGLIDITVIADERYLPEEQLEDLEQFRRWYYDLHINIEGIDALRHLVRKVNHMQQEIKSLKNRLRLHEEGW